jgi:Fe-S-cluster containining protein
MSEEEYSYQQKLREAQEDAVLRILEKEITSEKIVHVAENAAWFAKEMRDKIVHPQSPKIACKEKCHWCCHQSVGIFPPEIFTLVEHINGNYTQKEKKLLIDKLEDLDKKTRGKTPSARAKVNMPCAFLSYGNCSVYVARPLACRRQTSYDVSACKKAQPKGFPFGSIVSEKAQLAAYNGAIQGMVDGLRKGLPDAEMKMLDLTAAILAVLKGNITAIEWSDGSYRFEGCQLNT